MHIERRIHFHRLSVDLWLKITSRDSDYRLGSKFQCWSKKSEFENCFIFRIIQKKIGNFEGAAVHNTRYAEPLALIAGRPLSCTVVSIPPFKMRIPILHSFLANHTLVSSLIHLFFNLKKIFFCDRYKMNIITGFEKDWNLAVWIVSLTGVSPRSCQPPGESSG